MSAHTGNALMRGPVLLVGADGQLGTELRKALAARGIVPICTTRTGEHKTSADTTLAKGSNVLPCDLSAPDALAALLRKVEPALVLNAAAYTAVDRAETEHALARRINAEAVAELGEAAKALGATVVHYSTDYVFAGDGTRPYREDDTPGPMSVYGRSKLEGERALAASGADAITFRLAWVYGLCRRRHAALPRGRRTRSNVRLRPQQT